VNRFRASAVLLLLLGCASGAARADILVTRDGVTIETVGPWQVQGRQIIFTLPGGQLSSIRADRVDLDQSAVATEQALHPPAPAAAEVAAEAAATAPVMTITDADVTPPAPPVEEGDTEVEGDAPEVSANGPLEVVSWDRVDMPDGDGVEVAGTLRNNGNTVVTAPTLTIFVYGEGGGLLATSDATITLDALAPGRSTNFRAPLPGLHEYAAIKFEVGGRGYQTRSTSSDIDQDTGEETVTDAGGEYAVVDEDQPAEGAEVDVDPGAQYDDMANEPEVDSPGDAYDEPAADEPPPIDEEPAYDEPVDDTSADEPPPTL